MIAATNKDLKARVHNGHFSEDLYSRLKVFPIHIQGPVPVIKPKKIIGDVLVDDLDASGWNKAEVGRCLNESRVSVWKCMKKWGLPAQKEDW